jgi:hypothetical protein
MHSKQDVWILVFCHGIHASRYLLLFCTSERQFRVLHEYVILHVFPQAGRELDVAAEESSEAETFAAIFPSKLRQ